MKNKYEVRGDVTAIFIKWKGDTYETLIDTEDLEKVKLFPNSWTITKTSKSKSLYVTGRKTENFVTKRQLLHRYIMNTPRELDVDHIFHKTLDNRKSQLRNVTHGENARNMNTVKKNTTSNFRGVCWDKKQHQWLCQVYIKGKSYTIGYFDELEEAKAAITKARAKLIPGSHESRKIKINPKEEIFHKMDVNKLRSNSKSGYRNVSWSKETGKWQVNVCKQYKQIFLGYYDDIEEAVKARDEYRKTGNIKLPDNSNKLISTNTSGVKGVYWHKTEKKWRAFIGVDGKRIQLGDYKEKEDAIRARKEYEDKLQSRH